MAGLGDEMADSRSQARGGLRASRADREQVVGAVRAALVQGRLTEDELGARVDRVYASRTYAELAEVIADIPTELTGARPRATHGGQQREPGGSNTRHFCRASWRSSSSLVVPIPPYGR